MQQNTAERVAFIAELSEFIHERKDLTLGQILYSFCRPMGKEENRNVSILLEKTDSQILNKIEKAKIVENDN
jgi:hypothetical protein